jgi:beta-barrel assembly-enhancing protease
VRQQTPAINSGAEAKNGCRFLFSSTGSFMNTTDKLSIALLLCLCTITLHGDTAKNDLERIGNRRVARRSIMTEGMETRLGKLAAGRLERSVKFVQDPQLNAYVNSVGNKIAANSDLKIPVKVSIIDARTFNASSLPGGYLYVTTGLLENLDHEGELAAALSHEIGHLAARHGASQTSKRILMDGAGLLPFGSVYMVAAAVSQPLTLAKFSRGQELEADFLALQYLYKSGYDPNALVTLLQKAEDFEPKQQRHPSRRQKAYANHPQIEERIARARKEIHEVIPARKYMLASNTAFEDLRNRLLNRMIVAQPLGAQPATPETASPHSADAASNTEPFDLNGKPELEIESDRAIEFTPPVLEHVEPARPPQN